MGYSKLFSIIALVMLGSTALAQVHEAAGMMGQVKVNENVTEITKTENRKQILDGFKNAYKEAGMPSIAVFWNREFDDQLSQWYQLARRSVTGEASLKSKDKFEPSGGNDPAYERNLSGGGKIVSSEYVEVRDEKQQRDGLNESEGFEFASGFTSTMLMVPSKIIDRQAIMRLVQRDNAQQAGAEMISDFQKIETDSLIGYADFLAEILLTPDSGADAGWSFMVTVKSVSNGQIVAMFKSAANNPFEQAPKERWIATSNGYQKVSDQREIGSPTQVGEQLAYETMQALSKIWK